MRKVIWLGIAVGGFVLWWRRHPRFGATWVNRVVDPWLVRRGVVSGSKGEIGLLEHVGRKSRVLRVTPVHPVPTGEGFRIIVPLGVESQWAQNVLAAGHCRMQVNEVIHELDEPQLVMASTVEGVPKAAAAVMDWLGFRYLLLRRFAQRPGTLETRTETEGAAGATAATPQDAVPTS
jgi:deazaflavin-dependent oxidoreductase (nitroreductase family)